MTPFDKITDAVRERTVDAGLIIHEAQLTFDREGFHRIVDLGRWFKTTYGLPLPLGGNVLLRSLDPEIRSECCRLMRESIQYALDNHDEALEYALQFARDMEPRLAEKFVGMYVNHYTAGCRRRGAQGGAETARPGLRSGPDRRTGGTWNSSGSTAQLAAMRRRLSRYSRSYALHSSRVRLFVFCAACSCPGRQDVRPKTSAMSAKAVPRAIPKLQEFLKNPRPDVRAGSGQADHRDRHRRAVSIR